MLGGFWGTLKVLTLVPQITPFAMEFCSSQEAPCKYIAYTKNGGSHVRPAGTAASGNPTPLQRPGIGPPSSAGISATFAFVAIAFPSRM